MGVRHRGRKALLQILFAMDVNEKTFPENLESMRHLLTQEEAGIGAPLEMEEWVWITSLGRAVIQNRDEIDSRIEAVLENWTLERLSPVIRLILEQAIAEVDYCDPPIPAPVAIDEAVELAREFDAEESPAFINGVLDRINRLREAD